jgi:hypothetical protein
MRYSVVPSLVALALSAALSGAAGCGRAAEAPLAYVAVGGQNHVRVIDLDSGETLRKIYAGAGPWRLVPSPDGAELWAQHWVSGTTAVIGLADHEVRGLVPLRGPGVFEPAGHEPEGARFLSFDWPASALSIVDRRTLETSEPLNTGIQEVYDLVPEPESGQLHVVQHDPMARGPAPRYAYLASFAYDPQPVEPAEEGESPAEQIRPVSRPTGQVPVQVLRVPGHPFLLTADSGTNGLTVLNALGDGRSLAACRAPRGMALSPDAAHLAVVCWEGGGRHDSRVVLFATDFDQRPWPVFEQVAVLARPGRLAGAAFPPAGESLYVLDRSGGRLVELSLPELAVVREIDAGSEPLDLVILPASGEQRERLAVGPGEARRKLLDVLERGSGGKPGFTGLAWTETVARPAPAGEEEQEEGEEAVEPELVVERRSSQALWLPDAVRAESEDGGLRLSRGGVSLVVERDGRFWVTPRQELLSKVLALPALAAQDAVALLAGDVADGRFLSSGLAVDVAVEVEEAGERYLVVGADRAGRRVAQLWLDAATGRPVDLVEQFPSFDGGGHGGGGGGVELVETKLRDWQTVAGIAVPAVLERVVEGTWLQEVRWTDVEVDPPLPAEWFDPAELGGAVPAAGLFHPASAALAAAAAPGPGRPVPVQEPAEILAAPFAPQGPYASNPPTSGAHLPYTGDWGWQRSPVPLVLQVHHLLDGGVLLQHHCPQGCPELVARLEELAAARDFVVVAPYPYQSARLTLTAWGRMEELDGYDEARVEAFLDAYATGRGHHGEGGY